MSKFVAVFNSPVNSALLLKLETHWCIPIMLGKMWLLPKDLSFNDFWALVPDDMDCLLCHVAGDEYNILDANDRKTFEDWLSK